ncbi:DNA mismatch repair endonuclease MutL [Natranaeroarchaeum aerophilus]|uniref:DNA mismatch repair protein MutL n=1 Tax=Natranaeroarchaeum aerophilus TaxID=2917711 RepID=A0AAE3FS89_9EURY|nr:DNA mismatch repair endonuclease MutL [Natranaeroarchaeum aerophilus]MCL9814221.1 DNA mismatch repair endonuclease MutL [Natranaeroarchaeum aerophilus]
MTDTDIKQLDERTVQRIAAGEVVERPASAVKELVENSLDADASRIDVSVEAGGTESIRVRDDGMGMSEADVRAAVREHTTSKIDDVSDLEAGVATLGFRGEALHTIGAVARLTITTKPRGAEGAGTKLVFVDSEVESVEPAGCPEGTTVEVTDLFFNTPARKKYLKTETTEFTHVNRVVTQYALANPDVAVSLEHDGREVFATTGQDDLQSTILSVYGKDVATDMIPVDAEPAVGSEFPEGPLDGISGYVSHPETNRSTREYVSTFINGRYVTSGAAREAIMDAYDGQLGNGRYPFVVLDLSVPADTVDVNVHPRKMEVRFDDEAGFKRQLEAAVEDALLDHGLVRSSAPRGRSAPDETQVTPSTETMLSGAGPSDGESASDQSVERESGAGVDDRESASSTTGTSPSTDGPDTNDGDSTAAASRPESDSPSRTTGSATERSTHDADTTAEPDPTPASTPMDTSTAHVVDSDSGSASSPESGAGSTDRPEPQDSSRHSPASTDSAKFTGPHDQETLSGEVATAEASYDSLPRLRVLGQLHDTYIVAETDDGLVLIDQHAADERVNYERLQEAFSGDTTAQSLAQPVEIELTAGEAALFDSYREALASLGFYANREGHRVSVTTVPAVLDETLAPERLRDVLSSVIDADESAGEQAVESLADGFIGDLACYPSITGNTSLQEGSVMDLLDRLDECENPYACPHGRPVVIEIDGTELEDRFERDYPGHSG